MAVFDWVESPGTSLQEEPRVARSQFGDGYHERAPAGLNPVTQRWQMQFSGVERAVADEIVAFFRARVTAVAGLEAFDWTPLWATAAIRVICTSWTRVQDGEPDTESVTATFEQVHEP